jgi:hypothetical protein
MSSRLLKPLRAIAKEKLTYFRIDAIITHEISSAESMLVTVPDKKFRSVDSKTSYLERTLNTPE